MKAQENLRMSSPALLHKNGDGEVHNCSCLCLWDLSFLDSSTFFAPRHTRSRFSKIPKDAHRKTIEIHLFHILTTSMVCHLVTIRIQMARISFCGGAWSVVVSCPKRWKSLKDVCLAILSQISGSVSGNRSNTRSTTRNHGDHIGTPRQGSPLRCGETVRQSMIANNSHSTTTNISKNKNIWSLFHAPRNTYSMKGTLSLLLTQQFGLSATQSP